MATTLATNPVPESEKPATDEIKLQEGEVQETPAAPIKVFAFQYPPFPPKPEGKTIISFKDFKPKGVIPADSDEDEFDAEGVRTVRLPVKHIPDPAERAAYERLKRARKRRRGNQGAGLGPASKKREDGPTKAWLEEWEDDAYRERITAMPPHTSREERFTQIMTDFQTDRTFPRSIQSIYDNFRIFCGLLEHVHNPPGSKRAKRKKKAADDQDMGVPDGEQDPEEAAEQGSEGAAADDSSDDLEEPPSAPEEKIREVTEEEEAATKKSSGFGAKLPKAVPWNNSEKMDRFLDNPEAMIKLFFSHFSYERGMIWDVEKRRYGPFLVKFILDYIIRHGTMKEMKADFERALKIVDRAKIEQPAVGELADVVPDSFHIACREHFGRWDIGMWGSAEDTNWADNMNVDPDVAPLPEDGWGASSGKFGLVTDEDLQKEGMSIDPAASDGWDLPAEVTVDPLADNSSEGEAPPPAPAKAEADTSGWDVAPSWEAAKLPALTDFYPEAPKDMKIIRVEHSVRQILSVEPPNPNSASEFRKPVGVITLVPWPRHSEDLMTYTPFPKIDKEDFDDIPVTPPHDPLKDTIRVLASPETIEKLSERLGMGINGYWVQVAKKKTDSESTPAGPAPSKKKKKGKSTDPDSSQYFWYLETSTQILQTYWVEPEDL